MQYPTRKAGRRGESERRGGQQLRVERSKRSGGSSFFQKVKSWEELTRKTPQRKLSSNLEMVEGASYKGRGRGLGVPPTRSGTEEIRAFLSGSLNAWTIERTETWEED